MKKENQINRQLKEVKFRYYKELAKKRFKENKHLLEKMPCSCKYNKEIEIEGKMIGVCTAYNLLSWKINHPERETNICYGEDKYDLSKNCDLFTFKITEEDIKEQVKEEIEEDFSKTIGYIASKYPDAAALLWVLDKENDSTIIEVLPKEEENTALEEKQKTIVADDVKIQEPEPIANPIVEEKIKESENISTPSVEEIEEEIEEEEETHIDKKRNGLAIRVFSLAMVILFIVIFGVFAK